MKVLLCGGGTAGHISPAIAIAEEIINRDKDASILFIGREGGKENEAVVKAGFRLKTIKIQGLKRSFSISNITRIFKAIEAKQKVRKMIQDFAPDIILGTGGYVCWPIILAGKEMSIPVAIHESNVSAGLTTRLLAKKCDRVFLGKEETKHSLNKKAKTLTVGNPLQKAFTEVTRKEARRILGIKDNEIFILSFGGSIGADKLNQVLLKIMKNHSAKIPHIKHTHATGQRYYDSLESEYKKGILNGCNVLPYINDMPIALNAADIVICRGGAITISELAAVGVAAIIIPSPNVSENHQFKNAEYLSKKDAAAVIEEKNLSEESLLTQLLELETDKNRRKNRAKKIKEFAALNSAKNIVDELFLIKNN